MSDSTIELAIEAYIARKMAIAEAYYRTCQTNKHARLHVAVSLIMPILMCYVIWWVTMNTNWQHPIEATAPVSTYEAPPVAPIDDSVPWVVELHPKNYYATVIREER